MDSNKNYKYFEEYYDALKKLQSEDKFFECIKLIEEIGILKTNNWLIFIFEFSCFLNENGQSLNN